MLSKEEIEEIAEKYPSHISGKIKKRNEDLHNRVNENYKGEKFTERLYRFLYGNENSICALKTCECEVRFLSFTRGFRKFCSRDCSAKKENSKETVECVYCEKELEAYKSANKKYCSHNCYVKHRVEKEDFNQQLRKARESFWNDDIEKGVEEEEIVSKKDIKKIAEEHQTHLLRRIKSVSPKTKVFIDSNIDGETFSEKVYRFVYDEINNECNVNGCNNPCTFDTFSDGYKRYCSPGCAFEEIDYSVIKEKRKSTLMEKYGVDHPAKMENHVEKVKKTKKRKYGDENYNNIEKMKETCEERYGGVGFASDEINEKIKTTCQEIYGDLNYNNREKFIKTLEEKYNQKIPPKALKKLKKRLEKGEVGFGSDKYLNSIREKYDEEDLENVSQAEEIKREKKKNRLKEKYEKLFDNPKFSDKVDPLFSFDNYEGGYLENAEKTVPRYPFKCKECGEEFEDRLHAGNVPRCPNCYDGWNHVGASEKEKMVANFMEEILPESEEVIKNDRNVLNGKELDVFIPSKQIAIEFDGLYWHSELQGDKEKDYHLKKTQTCEERGIHLIHIFENEWTRKREIVKSRLRHILGQSAQSPIYARKCSVKQIDTQTKSEFLESHHIQGAGRSKVKLGIFHGEFFNSRLVGVMTFGTPSVAQGHKEDGRREQWEMKRFALSRPVVGGAGKLFKHFTRNFDPAQVKTYADRRWSTKLDNVYEKIGFEYVGSSEPNYYYFRREKSASQELKHRFNFRKNVLDEKLDSFDPELTEWENMQKNGYDRMWDCGHLKYQWTRS